MEKLINKIKQFEEAKIQDEKLEDEIKMLEKIAKVS